MRIRAVRIVVIVALVLAVPLLWALVATVSFGRGDRICRGVVVSGIDVSGQTKSAAGSAVRQWARERANRGMTLTALDTRWTGTLADLGGRIEWRQAIDRAFAVGREGNVVERAVCVLSSGGGGKRIQAPVVLDRAVLRKTVSKVAAAINRPHRDARLSIVDDRLHIEQDSWGIKLNEKRAVVVVSRALAAGKSTVALSVESDRPDVTARDAARVDTLLSRYVTPFNPGNRNRTHNLTLAAKAISGIILKPGQEFSYNNSVGPRLAERGFEEAPIFVRGKIEPGLGGGVCQVSSTLYNSVLLAGLDVVERHHHSRTVVYVIPGRDATVAYGARDFRFKNSNSSPIGVVSKVSGGRLAMDIYGAAKDKKNIEIVTSAGRHIPAGTSTVRDDTLASGVTKVVDKGSTGVSVTVYKKTTGPDGKVTTEVISRDRYSPQNTIVAVGPAAKPAVTPMEASNSGSNGVGSHTD